MKRGALMVLLFVLGIVVVSGCVPRSSLSSQNQKETDLVKELQEIERQINEGAQDTNDSELDDALSEDTTEDTVAEEGDIITGAATGDVTANESAEEQETTEAATEPESDLETVVEQDASKLQRIEVEETQLVNLQIEAEDADKDAILYTFSPPVSANGTWQTGYGDAGEYAVTVTASDGENKVEQQVLLVVNKKNVPPVIKGLPEKLDISEGEAVKLEPVINDPNKDQFTVTYSSPLGENGEWTTDHTSAGEYEIKVTASDGEAESQATVLLSVKDVNMPPEITGIPNKLSIKEGETVSLKPEVTDLDNDQLEVSISEPIGDDGIWETNYTSHGRYTVTVTASDGKDTVSKEVELVVEDVNVAPKIIIIRQG